MFAAFAFLRTTRAPMNLVFCVPDPLFGRPVTGGPNRRTGRAVPRCQRYWLSHQSHPPALRCAPQRGGPR
eukprot:6301456-Prorocentrum_lima.AAC.1